MKDKMKRETFMQHNGWTGPWRDFDLYGVGHDKYVNNEKKKAKRRARHRMKQEFNKRILNGEW